LRWAALLELLLFLLFPFLLLVPFFLLFFLPFFFLELCPDHTSRMEASPPRFKHSLTMKRIIPGKFCLNIFSGEIFPAAFARSALT